MSGTWRTRAAAAVAVLMVPLLTATTAAAVETTTALEPDATADQAAASTQSGFSEVASGDLEAELGDFQGRFDRPAEITALELVGVGTLPEDLVVSIDGEEVDYRLQLGDPGSMVVELLDPVTVQEGSTLAVTPGDEAVTPERFRAFGTPADLTEETSTPTAAPSAEEAATEASASEEAEPERVTRQARPRTPTARREPSSREARVTVTARTFDDGLSLGRAAGHPQNYNVNVGESRDTRYTEGLTFRLYETIGSSSAQAIMDAGPQSPLRQEWAQCVTDATGSCDIFVPDGFGNKRYFVVQESDTPETYHVNSYTWAHRVNDSDVETTHLVGMTDILRTTGRSYDSPGVNVRQPRDRDASLGAMVQSLNNPPIEQVRKCQAGGGPKVALVMDTTTSVQNAGGAPYYRDAVYGNTGFLQALRGTGAEVAMFSFAFTSPAQGDPRNYPVPLSVDTAMPQLVNQATDMLNNFGGVTNWSAGFYAAEQANALYDYDEVIFVTDGAPNRWFPEGGLGTNVNYGSRAGVEAGVYIANRLKEAGTRVVSIGVGSAETSQYWNGEGQLKAVSGPVNGLDYFGTDWQRLAATLRTAATQISCQVEISVDKQIVDADGRPLADASHARELATGWDINLEVSDIVSNPDLGNGQAAVDVPPAVISPNADPGDDGAAPLVLRDTQETSSGPAGHASTAAPSADWFLTFYGSPPEANNATVTITEDQASRGGFEFVPGQRRADGSYTGSYYEIWDYRTGVKLSDGALRDPQLRLPQVSVEQRIEVTYVNRQVFAVNKQAASEFAQLDASGDPAQWSADYTVNLEHLSQGRNRSAPILDAPSLPEGFVLDRVEVDGQPARLISEYEGQAYPQGAFLLTEGVTVGGAQTRAFKVTLSGHAQAPIDETEPKLQCQGNSADTYGGGLYNRVAMTGDNDGPENNWACETITVRKMLVNLGILKYGTDAGGTTAAPLDPLSSGWEFTLYEVAEDGSLTAPVVLTEKVADKPLARFTGEVLRPGVNYAIVETRAPQGFELLANEIRFQVVAAASAGGYRLEVANDDELGNSIFEQDSHAKDTVLIHVADVRRGVMPLTGGKGVYWLLGGGLALVLIAAAAWAVRRRRQ